MVLAFAAHPERRGLKATLAETSFQWIYAAANACRSTSSWPVQLLVDPLLAWCITDLPCQAIARQCSGHASRGSEKYFAVQAQNEHVLLCTRVPSDFHMAKKADEAWLLSRFSSWWMLTEAMPNLIPPRKTPDQVRNVKLQLDTL